MHAGGGEGEEDHEDGEEDSRGRGQGGERVGDDASGEEGDLEDAELLSRIAGAASAEELSKVQAEIEAALGLEHMEQPELGGSSKDGELHVPSSSVSGLTPNVAHLHVGGKHL